MHGLEAIKSKDLEKVVNDGKFKKRPFVYFNPQEVETISDFLNVFPTLTETPPKWHEFGSPYAFHPVNPTDLKAFRRRALKFILSHEKEIDINIGFAITQNVDDFITVQAYIETK